MKKNIFGFTLIELMIVIAILGILTFLISGNFFQSLKRGRDTRRKADVQNIQKAIEIYYEDKNAYPPDDFLTQTKLCYFDGSAYDCDKKVYMQRLPEDPTVGQYVYETDANGTYYKLYSCIENDQDTSSGIKLAVDGTQDPSGYMSGCGTGVCDACKFMVSSSNAE